jgi:hypothetical protein
MTATNGVRQSATSTGENSAAPVCILVDAGNPYESLERDVQMVLQHIADVDGRLRVGPTETKNIEAVGKYLTGHRRKPIIAVRGLFDAGKSTVLNTILGAPILPVSYQPATSWVFFLRHIDDRPSWMARSDPEAVVWVFDRSMPQEMWRDEEVSRVHLIESGGISLLAKGAHEYDEETSDRINESTSRVAQVFLDCPVLRSCTLIDQPGDGADEGDDQAVKLNTVL